MSGLIATGVLVITGTAAAEPKTHDGFYFRGATGLGYMSSSASAGGLDLTYSGVAIGFDAWFGGSPTPGLAIGGGITSYDVPSPSIKVNGSSGSVSGTHLLESIVAVFGDYYFDPNKGMHLEALAGFGDLSAQNSNGSSGNDATGLALGAGFGNDWWVSDEWSIGVLGRFIYAPLSLSGVKYSTITPAVMATFTFN